VNKPGIISQGDDLGIGGIMYAGIDIYGMPFITHGASQFADVDAHAPGVFSPQITQGATMHA